LAQQSVMLPPHANAEQVKFWDDARAQRRDKD
jgi:hypothetical protein